MEEFYREKRKERERNLIDRKKMMKGLCTKRKILKSLENIRLMYQIFASALNVESACLFISRDIVITNELCIVMSPSCNF